MLKDENSSASNLESELEFVNDQYYNNLSYDKNKITYINNKEKIKKKICDLNLQITSINLKEITKFCMDVSETLLINKEKEEKINLINEHNPLIDNLVIKTDEFRLKQILLNFLSNSVKFTKFGFIKLKTEILENNQIKISVEDTGLGIKDENKNYLFHDKIRLNTSKNYNYEGSGLGLSISKSIADKLDIVIDFSSIYGKGSVFYVILNYEGEKKINNIVYKSDLVIIKGNNISDKNINIMNIPLQNIIINDNFSNKTILLEEKDFKFSLNKNKKKLLKKYLNKIEIKENDFNLENNLKNKILKDELENNIFLKKKYRNNYIDKMDRIKILIVDDHKIIRKTLKNLCQKIFIKYSQKDYEIIEANDGVDIIYYLVNDQSQNNKIKCVITDENMEYMNGSEAIKIVRKLEKFNKIKYTPIASITAFENNYMKDYIIKKGSDFILSKPCNESHLREFFEKFNII